MTLTKAQIVSEIAERNGFPNKQSAEIVENLLELIKKPLESGDDVLISGFGKLCVKEKKQRSLTIKRFVSTTGKYHCLLLRVPERAAR